MKTDIREDKSMNWMFWKNDGQPKRLPGPKNIPQAVGAYLVTKEKCLPTWSGV